MPPPLRVLFLKRGLGWPRRFGHDIHALGMIRGLVEEGHRVALATFESWPAEALSIPDLEHLLLVEPQKGSDRAAEVHYTRVQERFRRYWGADSWRVLAVRDAAIRFGSDAVIAVQTDNLPYFPALPEFLRVWYAADDQVRNYLGWIRPAKPRTWRYLRSAAVMLAYERAFRACTDRVWVVTRSEARAARRFGGFDTIDVLPNGVDSAFFSPRHSVERPSSCVFWGALDYPPNAHAITWFVESVWRTLHRARPDATLTVAGYDPPSFIRDWHGRHGIEVLPNAPDLRDVVSKRMVTVLPFVSRGGIKNKLLEAAAMGRAILCTEQAIDALDPAVRRAVVVATSALQWRQELPRLWDSKDRRMELGQRARSWVMSHHSWRGVARHAASSLTVALERASRRVT